MGKTLKGLDKRRGLFGTKEKNRDKSGKKEKYGKKRWQEQFDYNNSTEVDFTNRLSSVGLGVRIVMGDGSCFFRAIADQMCGNENEHYEYRTRIIDYIEENEDHFNFFIEDDEKFGDYIDRMRIPGEWGGHLELFAAAQCLNITILVLPSSGPYYAVASESNGTRTITVSFHDECHYNSIRLREDMNSSSAAEEVRLDILESIGNPDVTRTPNSSLQDSHSLVKQQVPWMSDEQITFALKKCNNDVVDTVEFLSTNPEIEVEWSAGSIESEHQNEIGESTIEVKSSKKDKDNNKDKSNNKLEKPKKDSKTPIAAESKRNKKALSKKESRKEKKGKKVDEETNKELSSSESQTDRPTGAFIFI